MRPWLLIILVILWSIQIHEAQGRRLRKGSHLPFGQQHHIQEFLEGMKNNDGDEKAIIEGSKHSSGSNRKLTMTAISSSPNTHKNSEENKAHSKSRDKKIGRKEENLSIDPSSMNAQQSPSPAPYPDILDLAGMDYSLARRKPPIHN